MVRASRKIYTPNGHCFPILVGFWTISKKMRNFIQTNFFVLTHFIKKGNFLNSITNHEKGVRRTPLVYNIFWTKWVFFAVISGEALETSRRRQLEEATRQNTYNVGDAVQISLGKCRIRERSQILFT